ncbi:uncharacterized protein LOC144159221 [Haemaphysalis longicornis]
MWIVAFEPRDIPHADSSPPELFGGRQAHHGAFDGSQQSTVRAFCLDPGCWRVKFETGEWQLRICEALPHKAVFTFAGDLLEFAVTLGDSVEQPGACTNQAMKDAASGKVRRRTKRIVALRLRICGNAKGGPFSRFVCRRLAQQYKAGELLLQRYPTTDRLGEMLSEVGGHFVRHRLLSHDIGRATRGRGRCYPYTSTQDSELSIEVSHPRRLVWFHMNLPIDLDSYPHAQILPTSRPYSCLVVDPGDEYITISGCHRERHCRGREPLPCRGGQLRSCGHPNWTPGRTKRAPDGRRPRERKLARRDQRHQPRAVT